MFDSWLCHRCIGVLPLSGINLASLSVKDSSLFIVGYVMVAVHFRPWGRSSSNLISDLNMCRSVGCWGWCFPWFPLDGVVWFVLLWHSSMIVTPLFWPRDVVVWRGSPPCDWCASGVRMGFAQSRMGRPILAVLLWLSPVISVVHSEVVFLWIAVFVLVMSGVWQTSG